MSVRRTSNKTKGGYWLRFLGFANRARAPLRWARARRTSSSNGARHSNSNTGMRTESGYVRRSARRRAVLAVAVNVATS